jgi:AcrR family transcriptional regulator
MARPQKVSDDDILAAVRDAVVAQGPHVSLDVVAERLGVTAPALFRRFGSRQDLMLKALAVDAAPPFLAWLAAGPDRRPLAEQLVELFTLAHDYFQRAVPCLTALRESGIPLTELYKGESSPLVVVRALTAWLERARDRKLAAVHDVEAAAVAMLGSLQAPAFLRHVAHAHGPWDVTRWARPFAELYLCGLSRAAAATKAKTGAATKAKTGGLRDEKTGAENRARKVGTIPASKASGERRAASRRRPKERA